jgi:hypothetical protein
LTLKYNGELPTKYDIYIFYFLIGLFITYEVYNSKNKTQKTNGVIP